MQGTRTHAPLGVSLRVGFVSLSHRLGVITRGVIFLHGSSIRGFRLVRDFLLSQDVVTEAMLE